MAAKSPLIKGTRERVLDAALAVLHEQGFQSLTQPQVAAALDESTCFVLPSRSEGMGRVVIEAFCRGRGVVGSRVGGIPELVDDGVNGLLVDVGDVDRLADAIVRGVRAATSLPGLPAARDL